jgi:hypothetical protein
MLDTLSKNPEIESFHWHWEREKRQRVCFYICCAPAAKWYNTGLFILKGRYSNPPLTLGEKKMAKSLFLYLLCPSSTVVLHWAHNYKSEVFNPPLALVYREMTKSVLLYLLCPNSTVV